MAASKRLFKELGDLKSNLLLGKDDCNKIKALADVLADDSNIHRWQVTLSPEQPPYKGFFKIEIEFPPEYPFKPPKIEFKTKIYHPNIDESGKICLPIISADNWKPATKTDQVIRALVNLIVNPEPGHPLRGDIAEEYTNNRKKYMKDANEYTQKHAMDKSHLK